jgi:hypothetical protein
MSKIMWVLGLVLAAVGILLGAKSIISPGQMQIYGLTPETAAVLLVGGILSLGLGSVISGLRQFGVAPVAMPEAVKTIAAETPVEIPTLVPGFGRKAVETAGSAAVVAASETKSVTSAAASTASNSVADTIAALEQAKSDIKTALGGVESMTTPDEHLEPVHAVMPEPAAETEADAEVELYVVEEKIIRGRPSRILSDDTVEAETDEGWMRFENLEHLNEYLDSMEPNEA